MKALKSIVNVRRAEVPLVLLMFLYFFLVIAVFWVLKPIKKDVFVSYYNVQNEAKEYVNSFLGLGLDGAQTEQLAKLANMVVAFFAVVAFTILSKKYHRHQLTVIFSGFSIAMIALFAFTAHQGGDILAWSFYLFGDLFNTLMVATFFVFLNDSVKPADAKRLYGPIVLGGVSGGAVGSLVVAGLIKDLSVAQWMWLCIGMTVVIAIVASTAGKLVDRQKAAEPAPEKPKDVVPATPPSASNPAVEGAKIAFKSKYLLSIVVMVALYEIISTILDFQFTSTVYGLLDRGPDVPEKERFVDAKAHLSMMYFITNMVGLGIQLFATTFIMERFGLKIALLIMPFAILTNSLAYLVIPILWVGSFLNTSDNGLNYSLNQSSREALWTPTSRDEKYKAKAFIDMFVVRFAKALAVGLNLLISTLIVGLGGIRWLSLFAVVLIAIWILAARYAGKQFEDLAKDSKK